MNTPTLTDIHKVKTQLLSEISKGIEPWKNRLYIINKMSKNIYSLLNNSRRNANGVFVTWIIYTFFFINSSIQLAKKCFMARSLFGLFIERRKEGRLSLIKWKIAPSECNLVHPLQAVATGMVFVSKGFWDSALATFSHLCSSSI